MLIPGSLISLLTFPGIMIHEWAHKKFCDWSNIKVHKVVYFRFGNPAGYVLHDQPQHYRQIFWISIGPLIINSLMVIVLSFISSQVVPESFLQYFLIWVAFSSGMHSFPSDQDMQSVLSSSKDALKRGGSILHYLSFPFVWLVWIANKLRFLWFDAAYSLILIGLGGSL